MPGGYSDYHWNGIYAIYCRKASIVMMPEYIYPPFFLISPPPSTLPPATCCKTPSPLHPLNTLNIYASSIHINLLIIRKTHLLSSFFRFVFLWFFRFCCHWQLKKIVVPVVFFRFFFVVSNTTTWHIVLLILLLLSLLLHKNVLCSVFMCRSFLCGDRSCISLLGLKNNRHGH